MMEKLPVNPFWKVKCQMLTTLKQAPMDEPPVYSAKVTYWLQWDIEFHSQWIFSKYDWASPGLKKVLKKIKNKIKFQSWISDTLLSNKPSLVDEK